VICSHN